MCAEFGQLDVHATAQAGSQVRWAGEDETKMLVPHETVVVLLEDILNLEHNTVQCYVAYLMSITKSSQVGL